MREPLSCHTTDVGERKSMSILWIILVVVLVLVLLGFFGVRR
jgi:flagellar basal body-associated protein FliL